MKKTMLTAATSISALLLTAATLTAGTPSEKIVFTDNLDILTTEGGQHFHFTVGIGSGACRLASDPENVIYTVTDRGPNIKTVDGQKLLGLSYEGKSGKIFPTPNFAPTIYKLTIADGRAEVIEKIQIKDDTGIPVSGISNPDTEPAWDINGNTLTYDPEGIDAEGIVKIQDGTFWVGEEYGPSILHVAGDGKVIERWVPEGVKAGLTGSGYDIKEKLPAILRMRPLNRGIESMTGSPDGRFLYFAMQSPLANPDKQAYMVSRNLRIFKIDRKAGEVVGEYLYQIDPPESFQKDYAKKKRKQNAVKVSELTAVGSDILVVLERISSTTRFFRIDLSGAENILGSKWDDPATSPSLEQSLDVAGVEKKLLMDTDSIGGLMKKIEGLAWMGGDRWIMVNDNDFGITGDPTEIATVTMDIE